MSTPTKAAEIIREALEYGLGMALAEQSRTGKSHSILMQHFKDALSLLADLDGGGDVVAWMSPNGVCISAKMRDLGMNDHGKELYSTPLYTHPSPTAADAPPDPDAHITDQDQYLKAKQERAKDVDFEHRPDETIEQQARREAEVAYHSSGNEMSDHKKRQCFVAGWMACAERSKPQPSVDQIMSCIDNYFSDSRFEVPWDILDRGELRDRLTKKFNK